MMASEQHAHPPAALVPLLVSAGAVLVSQYFFNVAAQVPDPALEHPHTVPADGAVGVEMEGHQVFWTCDDRPFILVLTTVPPHTDSLGVSTKTKAGLVTEDDPLPF
ncbi:hypothetical protein NFI96_003071 [Prochilodus magdalenae]|nr:hypothetical protein NFI96_003071 [Prochilodus magdalenae]